MNNPLQMQTKVVSQEMDLRAPDRSEIRILLNGVRGGTCHCTLPPGESSLAGVHKTVEEIWYCIEGQGEIWRQQGETTSVVEITPGVCLTIPTHTHFQFRNTGPTPLKIIITTMPPWPGEDEWRQVQGFWEPHKLSK